VSAIATGAVMSVLLIVLSPTVLVDLLGYSSAVFPLRNPAIVSMPAAFAAGILASLLTREPEAELRFDDEKLRTYLGVGAE
jgi:cation/acetate symporter